MIARSIRHGVEKAIDAVAGSVAAAPTQVLARTSLANLAGSRALLKLLKEAGQHQIQSSNLET
jgi:hypothetical protein